MINVSILIMVFKFTLWFAHRFIILAAFVRAQYPALHICRNSALIRGSTFQINILILSRDLPRHIKCGILYETLIYCEIVAQYEPYMVTWVSEKCKFFEPIEIQI